MKAAVVVIGAGPVGLAVAGLLGRRGIPVTVLEREAEPARASQAIGVTPPSLEILAQIGCVEELIARGVPIESAVVNDERRRLGALGFHHLTGRYRFILAVPQHHTEAVLRDHLPGPVRYATEALAVHPPAAGRPEPALRVQIRGPGGAEDELAAAAVVVCAGARDRLGPALGLVRRRRSYRVSFAMGDFEGDPAGLGPQAHLFFTADGAVESFPLGPTLRRWIVQLPPATVAGPNPAEHVRALVRRRTGLELQPEHCVWQSAFTPERSELSRFALGSPEAPLLFAGDAAHTMPPIGGQGMNTGFSDALRAVQVLCGELTPAQYQRRRKHAFRVAARRARRSMAVGTLRRRLPSRLRAAAIAVALHSPAAGPLARTFAMQTLPDTPAPRPRPVNNPAPPPC